MATYNSSGTGRRVESRYDRAQKKESPSVTKEEVEKIVKTNAVVPINTQRHADDPSIVFTAQNFYANTEEIFVNGVRLCTDDYTLMVDSKGYGYGFVYEPLVGTDDVHVYGDIVEL